MNYVSKLTSMWVFLPRPDLDGTHCEHVGSEMELAPLEQQRARNVALHHPLPEAVPLEQVYLELFIA